MDRTDSPPLGVPLSVLDLVPVMQGSTPAQALANSVDLIGHAERFGYTRYWVAEHHNMVGIASAATSVVIGHLAAASSTIRVGSGGIMLPNHSPMAIAEQFGTLETLYPGRIDLGLGRAPGTDQRTLRALRTDAQRAEDFPEDVQLLQALLGPEQPDQVIRAVPGIGTEVPIWILGSSLFGAQLAAALGLPFAFASHFAPDALPMALSTYRSQFRPSDQLDHPYAMVGLNVVAAETDDEARYLLTTTQQAFANLRKGRPGQYPPPVDDIEQHWGPAEKAQAQHMLRYAVVGGPESVRAGIERVVGETGADELIVVTAVYEHVARVRSYEILADVTGIRASTQPSYAGSSHQG